MKRSIGISIIILCISCGLSKKYLENNLPIEQQPVNTTNNTLTHPKIDSACFELFYSNQDSFLNGQNTAITLIEEYSLIPCCMSLIKSGDTIANKILFERMDTRINMFLMGEEKYRSIFKILTTTLAKLPEQKYFDLSMKLFQVDSNLYFKDACTHIGYWIYKSVILEQIDQSIASRYKTQAILYYREALNNGLIGCQSEKYVYDLIKPIVLNDYLNHRITLNNDDY